MNEGFVRIDGDDQRYFALPDQIASVSGESVQLEVSRDKLMTT